MKLNPDERRQMAENYFLEGYNCTQAVVLTFSDLIPIDRKVLISMSSSFGGGMGRLREVCGAVSGMFMVVGALYGYDTPEKGAIKAEHYARIQHLAGEFTKENRSIVCRELLGKPKGSDSPIPDERTPEYYKKRPCKELIGMAAKIVTDFINENPFCDQ